MEETKRGANWAWSGLGASILGLVATWATQFLVSDDEYRAGGQVFYDALGDGNNELIWALSAGLGFVAIGLLAAYAAGVKRVLDRRAPDSIVPQVVLYGFLAAAGALLVGFIVRAETVDSRNYAEVSTVNTIATMGQDLPLAGWTGLGIAAAAIAVAGIRGRIVPKWFAWLSAVMAALVTLTFFAGVPFPGHIPAHIWLIASVFAMRSLEAAPASAKAPAPAGRRATAGA